MNDVYIAKAPYRVQSLNAIARGERMRGKNYKTFAEAQKAAEIQASNQGNLDRGNKFVVYKAVAIVGPEQPQPKPPIHTTVIDPTDPNLEGRN